MQAEIIHNGIVIKLTGTPTEIAETVKALSVPTVPVPTPTPWVQPVVPVIDPTWIFQPTTGTRLPGCICPQPGDRDYGQPWLGVCPAHMTTTCGDIRVDSASTLSPWNESTKTHITMGPYGLPSAVAVEYPQNHVWSVFGPVTN